jgi:hypothetical protein
VDASGTAVATLMGKVPDACLMLAEDGESFKSARGRIGSTVVNILALLEGWDLLDATGVSNGGPPPELDVTEEPNIWAPPESKEAEVGAPQETGAPTESVDTVKPRAKMPPGMALPALPNDISCLP